MDMAAPPVQAVGDRDHDHAEAGDLRLVRGIVEQAGGERHQQEAEEAEAQRHRPGVDPTEPKRMQPDRHGEHEQHPMHEGGMGLDRGDKRQACRDEGKGKAMQQAQGRQPDGRPVETAQVGG